MIDLWPATKRTHHGKRFPRLQTPVLCYSSRSGSCRRGKPYAGRHRKALFGRQQYNFAIHILAMLLVGSAFSWSLWQRYGYSATTGTYLVVWPGCRVFCPALTRRATADRSPFIPSEDSCSRSSRWRPCSFPWARCWAHPAAPVWRFSPPHGAADSLNEWMVLDGGWESPGFVDSAGRSSFMHSARISGWALRLD